MESSFDTSAVLDTNVNPAFDMASAIGSLLWIARMTRPDIFFAVIVLASFTTNFTPMHVIAVKRIMRYLKGTINYSLTFRRSTEFNGNIFPVLGYSDADWGGDLATRRSTSGAVLFFFGSYLRSTCRKQELVALSTAESELYALTEITKDWKALHNNISDLSLFTKNEYVLQSPATVFVDNVAAQFMGSNRVNNNRTRHIDMRYMHIREYVESGSIRIEHVSSAENIADIFTKALPYDIFRIHRQSLGVEITNLEETDEPEL